MTQPSRPNPYVGPRAYRTGEVLYGRDRELLKLLNLLIARRLVLLHSPSGAGKSSLIQAALIPRLRQEGFRVLPPVRVGSELPTGAPVGTNRYCMATMLAMEEELDPALQTPLTELASKSLRTYLDQRPGAEDGSDEVLIIDQFEEILTTDPMDQAGKERFFSELGAALQDDRRWLLVAIREDYLGTLKPYLRPIPTRLETTFRLNLLTIEEARQAMEGPALAAGVSFDAEAAQNLLDDLRRTVVQTTDGSSIVVPGPSVEPVQLQVVCLRLWEKLAPDASMITTKLLANATGDTVDDALAGYFSDTLGKIIKTNSISERQLRDWCEQQLISEGGLRGQVLREPERTRGLDNRAIGQLIDAHIIRAEERRGSTWYELAHDRLIEPIRQSNQQWRAQNLNTFQRQAALWASSNRTDDLLLTGRTLREGEQWARQNTTRLTPIEQEFLEACRKARQTVEREQRQGRLIRLLGIGSSVGFLAALILAVVAFTSAGEIANQRDRIAQSLANAETAETRAERAQLVAEDAQATAEASAQEAQARERVSRANELSSRAREAQLSGFPQRGLLTAIEAIRTSSDANEKPVLAARQALWDTLTSSGGVGFTNSGMTPIDAVDVSRNGTYRATARRQILDVQRLEPGAANNQFEHTSRIVELLFSPDEQLLASGDTGGQIRVWAMNGAGAPTLRNTLQEAAFSITALAFSPDSRLLAFSDQGSLWLVDLMASEPPLLLIEQRSLLKHIEFSTDGRTLFAADDSAILRWSLEATDIAASQTIISGDTDRGDTVFALSPDGRWLVAGRIDGTIQRWDLTAPEPASTLRVMGGHSEFITDLRFSPDSRLLASASSDATVRLWPIDTEDPNDGSTTLQEHSQPVVGLAFSEDGQRLISASQDRTAVSRMLDGSSTIIALRGHDAPLVFVNTTSDNQQIVTVDEQGTARLWNMNTPMPAAPTVVGLGSQPENITFSADRRFMAVVHTEATGKLEVWALNGPRGQEQIASLELPGLITNPLISSDNRWLIAVVSEGEQERVVVWDLTAPDVAASMRRTAPTEEAIDQIVVGANSNLLATVADTGQAFILGIGSTDIQRLWSFTEGDYIQIALSSDQRSVALAEADGTIVLYDLNAVGQGATTIPLAGTILADHLTYSPDGRWLVAIDSSGRGLLWDRSKPGTNPFTLDAGVATTLMFSPDSSLLAVASQQGMIFTWETTAPEPDRTRQVLIGHQEAIFALAFRADSRVLASGDEQGVVLLWQVGQGEQGATPLTLRSHEQAVIGLAFSADDRMLLSSSTDGTLRLWHLEIQELISIACRTAGRNLSDDEWRQLFSIQERRATCPEFP